MRKILIGLSAAAATVATVVGLTLPAQAAGPNYVALGDSYSAGTGGGFYGTSGWCYRSANAYPNIWKNSHSVSSFKFPACAGATTGTLKANQLGQLSSSTTMVTISIGGNDVGFADVMLTCQNDTEQACVNEVNEAKWETNNVLPGRLTEVYNLIKQKSPNLQTKIVMGYPRLFTSSSTASCFMSYNKRVAINDMANTLHSVISSRAASAGFRYVDVRAQFDSHKICSSDPWIIGKGFGVNSYHPNSAGYHEGYYPMLRAVTG